MAVGVIAVKMILARVSVKQLIDTMKFVDPTIKATNVFTMTQIQTVLRAAIQLQFLIQGTSFIQSLLLTTMETPICN